MLTGGIVEPGGGRAGSLSAYVVLSAGQGSRIFKVMGRSDAASVTEMPAETTVDLGRFKIELRQDLSPALNELHQQGGTGAITTPAGGWVCGLVRAHLREREGVEVD